ncbi:3-oxoacid CoA-transferase subunit B [Pelobacter seleniigenes]|uniref:3-oxoacid CoA-transferase subunit B n=1 Tax=Pelobacter seleniigenes TaxID=407188 RepID=UPI0004A706C9|nr:3-oxoacid CoA-transferase subunit B [Pelobacter seleniigenes]
MAELSDKDLIARRAAQELEDGDVVNLGIGLPTLVSNHVPDGVQITLHAENGILGMGPLCLPGVEDSDVINAGNQFVHILPGASFFDSATSFAIIRGGHVDVTVLGALQVDQEGNIASHVVPGKMVPGMGGAMDLVAGAKKVIVAMQHTAKGTPKIMRKCTLPLTGMKCVDMIITEKAVFEVTEQGLLLTEIMPGSSLADIQQSTEAELLVAEGGTG